jgi:hypothetical protein
MLDLLRRSEPSVDLKYATVQMWRQRESVPAAWIVPVLYLMTQRGHALGELLVDASDPFGVGDAAPAMAGA